MTAFINWIQERFTKVRPLPAQTYQYQSPPSDEPAYRLHLRIHNDGSGILIINASTILHLNATAAEYAFHLLKGTSPQAVAGEFHRRYRVGTETALQDFNDLRERIMELIHTPDLDPVSYLDFERVTPHSQSLTAPLRLDCALTYKLPPGIKAEYAPTKRVTRELTTEEWKTILDKAWAAGIPHVTYTGGEATLRADLPDLIAHAEKNGQVCGLLTGGLKLADKAYLNTLLQTGLDHLLFLLQPDKKNSWEALQVILPEDLFTTVHLTITTKNQRKADEALEKLAGMGVTSLSLSCSDASLKERMQFLRNQAHALDLTLRWDLPVPYSENNPVANEETEPVPPGSGSAWLYVEPDGDVLPAQGEGDTVLGNMLQDPWDTIYPIKE